MKGKRRLGELGERYAQELLKKQGYKLIERNFRSPLGEIDIIASDNEYICFIEVKTRTGNSFGTPAEAEDLVRRLRRTGAKVLDYYLISHKNLANKLRIDVVAIEVSSGSVKSARIIKVI